MRKIDVIVGVRPDFIIAAALNTSAQDFSESLDIRYIHTGQHYDPELSHDHIKQLDLEPIHSYLDISPIQGIGTLASIMVAYENQLRTDPPETVMVLGNSDSALACAQVASRYKLPIAHIDSGTRSQELGLIEEQNDMLIDRLSTFHFTSSEEDVINLIKEGYDNRSMIEIGNLRSDAVFMNLGHAEDSTVLDRYGLDSGSYTIVTVHHDHNLYARDFMVSLFTMLEGLSEQLRVYVVLHPKTALVLEEMPEIMLETTDNLQFIPSQNYHDMLKLLKNAALVITDSQGLQEETSILGVQCLTLGLACNRPVTLSRGTNTLVGVDIASIREKILAIMEGDRIDGIPIPGWDGKASQRLLKFISEIG